MATPMLLKTVIQLFCIGAKNLIFTFNLTVNVLFSVTEAVCNCCYHCSLARCLLRGLSTEVIYKFTTANRSTRSSLNKGKEKAEKHLSEKRWDMYPFQQHHTSVRLFISYIYAEEIRK